MNDNLSDVAPILAQICACVPWKVLDDYANRPRKPFFHGQWDYETLTNLRARKAVEARANGVTFVRLARAWRVTPARAAQLYRKGKRIVEREQRLREVLA